MVEHTEENALLLARDIVSDWDLETLIGYALTNLTSHYTENDEEFYKEWSKMYE